MYVMYLSSHTIYIHIFFFKVKNLELVYFELAYCNEDNAVTGIDIALTTPPSDSDALLTQYACPQTIQVSDCTQSEAKQYGWLNAQVASFNLLVCNDETQRSTQEGIYVVVEGYGGDPTRNNYFFLQATTLY